MKPTKAFTSSIDDIPPFDSVYFHPSPHKDIWKMNQFSPFTHRFHDWKKSGGLKNILRNNLRLTYP